MAEILEEPITFSKDELVFAKGPPLEIEIECPICLQVMLADPHLVTCCGHHFCGSCIKPIQTGGQYCPFCKEKDYQAVPNKDRGRIIKGLKVRCVNLNEVRSVVDAGCQWVGDLKDLLPHLNQGKREGKCLHEQVKCRYMQCEIRDQRRCLDHHEEKECCHRPFDCLYCGCHDTYRQITNSHYTTCPLYPIDCPNECMSPKLPRYHVPTHLSTCLLEPVECEFSWAGCQERPLRQSFEQHKIDKQLKHLSLLANSCERLSLSCNNLRVKLQRVHQVITVADSLPVLPLRAHNEQQIFFYSDACGYKMSALYIAEECVGGFDLEIIVHHGTFDSSLLWPFRLNILIRSNEDVILHHSIEEQLDSLVELPTKANDERHCFGTRFSCDNRQEYIDIINVLD